MHDAFGFEEYIGLELKKMEQLLKDMKTPLYPGCNEVYKVVCFAKASPIEGSKSLD